MYDTMYNQGVPWYNTSYTIRRWPPLNKSEGHFVKRIPFELELDTSSHFLCGACLLVGWSCLNN